MLVTVGKRDTNIMVPIKMTNAYVKYRFAIDSNGDTVVVAVAGNMQTERLNKEWHKVHTTAFRSFTRTPSILKPFIGKQFEQQIETMYPEDNEIFRMSPREFSISSFLSGSAERTIPYLSRKGMLVLPTRFIVDRMSAKMIAFKVSFAHNTEVSLRDGKMFAFFTVDDDPRKMTYPIHKYHGGMKTRQMTQLVAFLRKCGKEPSDYAFEEISPIDGFDFPILVFKEGKRD